MDTRKICIVLPVYWDTDAFLLLRDRVLRETAAIRPARVRFVVLDDSAGTDPGMERLRELSDAEIVTPPFNVGHQRALVFALRTIAPTLEDSEIVVTMDADGQDRPEDLPRLIAPLTDDGGSPHGLALALRAGRRERPAFKLAYRAFRTMFRVLTGQVVNTGNYAAYRGSLAKQVIGHPYFDMSYSATLISLRLPATMVPCERGERYAGQSRMNVSRLISHGLSMLMPFTEQIAVRALISFTVTIALAAVAAIAVLAVRLFTDLGVPGWATYTLLFLLTLSFVALGNFIVLFAVFSQSRAMSLGNLHTTVDGRARKSSDTAA